jgi:hypothetical protein
MRSGASAISFFGASLSVAVLLVVSFVGALVMLPGNSAAQTYSFATNSEYVDVHILKDGSVDIDYTFTFTNYGYMDGVDIGLPNQYYDASTGTATITVDGVDYQPALIHKSPNVKIGMAVEFTAQTQDAIQAHSVFSLKFHVNNKHMVYENEIVKGTVGIKFRPTWFSETYQQGPTGFLQARIFFPQGFANASEAVYLQDRVWNTIENDSLSGLVVATWNATSVSPSGQASGLYDFGAGFPSHYVDKYYKHGVTEALMGFFGSVAALLGVCWPIIFLAAFVALMYVAGRRATRKRAVDYFEPELSQAGAGPRRDLTAVEAAVVLERPLEMVATMILFGLVKKDKVRIESEAMPMKLAKKLGEKGDYRYEDEYLAAIKVDGTMDHALLKETLVHLVQDTGHKLRGFDYHATKVYYERICDAAWEQVKAAGTPEDFSKGVDQKHDWMMLDPNYDRRMTTIFIGYPYGVRGPNTARTTSTGSPSPAGKTLQSMANGYASKVKSAANNMTSSMKDLSKEVTSKTHPVPVVSASCGALYSRTRASSGSSRAPTGTMARAI